MSATAQIILSPRAQAYLAKAKAWPITLIKSIAAALDHRNEATQGYIVKNKLSVRAPRFGPKTTLGRRTSLLASSARRSAPVITGDIIRSAIGTNVRYGGVHEFGFSGTVKVKAFTRRQVSNDIVKGTGRRGFTARQKREKLSASGIARVRAHTRRVNIPARHMFRTGITDQIPAYGRDLSAAVVKTLSSA